MTGSDQRGDFGRAPIGAGSTNHLPSHLVYLRDAFHKMAVACASVALGNRNQLSDESIVEISEYRRSLYGYKREENFKAEKRNFPTLPILSNLVRDFLNELVINGKNIVFYEDKIKNYILLENIYTFSISYDGLITQIRPGITVDKSILSSSIISGYLISRSTQMSFTPLSIVISKDEFEYILSEGKPSSLMESLDSKNAAEPSTIKPPAYRSSYINLMLAAEAHFGKQLQAGSPAKKTIITDWLFNNWPRFISSERSENLIGHMATLIREPALGKGGNKKLR